MNLRLGQINFVNVLPVYYGLATGAVPFDGVLVPGTPVELNRQMASGDLDISPISSVEYPAHRHDYLLIPDLSLWAEEWVRSVLVRSKEHLKSIVGEPIATKGTSATSVALLKVVYQMYYEAPVEVVEAQGATDDLLSKYVGVLLVGDEALKELFAQGGEQSETVNDLGAMWNNIVAESMVYALWAVRKDVAERQPEAVAAAVAALKASREYGLAHMDEVVDQAAKRLNLPAAWMAKYFADLRYDFSDRARQGLLAFYDKAAEINLIEPCKELNWL